MKSSTVAVLIGAVSIVNAVANVIADSASAHKQKQIDALIETISKDRHELVRVSLMAGFRQGAEHMRHIDIVMNQNGQELDQELVYLNPYEVPAQSMDEVLARITGQGWAPKDGQS